jgi:hypothetical protein
MSQTLHLYIEGLIDPSEKIPRWAERQLTGQIELIPAVRISVRRFATAELPLAYISGSVPLLEAKNRVIKLRGGSIQADHGYFMQKDGQVYFHSNNKCGLALKDVRPMLEGVKDRDSQKTLDMLCQRSEKQLFVARGKTQAYALEIGKGVYLGHPRGPFYRITVTTL